MLKLQWSYNQKSFSLSASLLFGMVFFAPFACFLFFFRTNNAAAIVGPSTEGQALKVFPPCVTKRHENRFAKCKQHAKSCVSDTYHVSVIHMYEKEEEWVRERGEGRGGGGLKEEEEREEIEIARERKRESERKSQNK